MTLYLTIELNLSTLCHKLQYDESNKYLGFYIDSNLKKKIYINDRGINSFYFG